MRVIIRVWTVGIHEDPMKPNRLNDRASFFEQLADTAIKWMLTGLEKATGQVPKPKAWFDSATD
jgi:hypothetical protein